MESAVSLSTSSLAVFTISKALNRHFITKSPSLLRTRALTSFYTRTSFPSSSSFGASFALLPHPLHCVSNSYSSFATSGGGTGSGGPCGGGGCGGGGGGGDRSDGGDAKSNLSAGGAEDVSALPSDVIILDVGGMTCGGCAASVKRILESQAQVSSANVNLTTETAIVWPISEAKVVPNWQKQLGEELAKHLTSCGFKSNLRDAGGENFFSVFEKKMDEKRDRLRESGRELAVSWALCAVCLFGHLSHIFAFKAKWIHMFHSTGFHLSLSLFTLLGPGRQLILDGVKSLFKGAPNMNTLVGLGALSSFAVSSLAALIPGLGWKAFFEEPIMLIAFVLLGRNLEQRAKIKATSDMTGLLSILPSKARLLVHGDARDPGSIVEVPCASLSVGDQIVVLPGDRVPADGIVRAGRSTIDESSFTGEPLPVTKLPGVLLSSYIQVAAGSINLNGTLTVEVRRPGGETAVGDIVRLVEEAQSREAPVQRLADKVSGHFTYGVMALSAATFMFWNLFGTRVLPAAFHHGNPVSLALQLSCSVLVIACPCALGLATPTAVLVGTSLGATRGLLLRGGNVLEKFSMVKTIVFDKTGTLTIGRPVVTKVVTLGGVKITDIQQNLNLTWSEVEVLKLAAGVESNTIHPVGKAIVEAAQSAGCQNVKVKDGTFMEEPGFGAIAIIENKKVSVGTLDWVQRNGAYKNPFQEVEDLKNQSVVYVGVDNTIAGLIYLEDQIREDARNVVESLSRQGINVYMLSGDKKNTAEYVASIVGIPKEKVTARVKPDEKKKFITELQKDQNIVAMVGDGINDAAALASSHIGVAMGGGVGAAGEVSSIVLTGNRLSQLLDALELSRLTMKTVKQNLWWAFAYNIYLLSLNGCNQLLPANWCISGSAALLTKDICLSFANQHPHPLVAQH
ncbi:copper-transporting ATPase PAA1, chloroplastic isoform X3 [Hevea brasiliensis]|uniref:copper-transporting ATPase PAA1, chloroplastic isoform X3 n=1 Tax=Hevea brasiliensis TaxID=3981 RepID=UPI0025CCC03C|nr:copper-transporting ATPase PAA1, chloroplastic isoform X3 [Hevea brasiliensis]XP_057987872.1 copper-transporting ATPase PAA1, chloroplastic isoform X3 [Hevea brasiliensis]